MVYSENGREELGKGEGSIADQVGEQRLQITMQLSRRVKPTVIKLSQLSQISVQVP
jgi:hypothetical protein